MTAKDGQRQERVLYRLEPRAKSEEEGRATASSAQVRGKRKNRFKERRFLFSFER